MEPDKKKTKPSADVVLEIGENPNTNVEAIVSLNGDELGAIYAHQEPHQLTETIPEGRYNYALVVTYFESQYQYSAGECPKGALEGNGEISISDGDRFGVYDDCNEAYLRELN